MERAQGEGVDAAVVRGNERQGPRRPGEGVQRLGVHERTVRHHDEHPVPGPGIGERQLDRVGVPGAPVHEDVEAAPDPTRIGRHE